MMTANSRIPIIALIFLLLLAIPEFATAQPQQRPRRPLSEAAKQQIDQILPKQAPAKPMAKRKLLVFDRNVAYPGHGSIEYANYAFAKMEKRRARFPLRYRAIRRSFVEKIFNNSMPFV
jgi:hypothetical protein